MARKFNVRRSLELYNQHHVSRHQEGLFNFDPEVEPLKSELLSGKFTVLVSNGFKMDLRFSEITE